MKIVIDLQALQTGSRFRGIGRYIQSLVEAMTKNGEYEIILFLNDYNHETVMNIKKVFALLVPEDNIKVCHLPKNVYEMDSENTNRLKYAECIREAYIYSLKPDFLLVGTLFEGFGEDFVCSINQYYNIPTAVIFYDLIPLLNTEVYLADEQVNNWYMNKIKQIKKSQLLLSISQSARQEAIQHLKYDENKVINISTASNDFFYKTIIDSLIEESLREKFNIKKPFLMYSGATDDRKNHIRLIEAYSMLPKDIKCNHQLVFVGGMPDDHRLRFINTAKKFDLDMNQLIITGKVTDIEMNNLLNLSKAFIFPSWHEGFGLPALEAMQCGKAVIASNTSSLPEVVGREDALFDPYDTKAISEKIKQVLTDNNFRTSLEEHSLMQAKKFSWDTTAKIAIDALKTHHNNSKASASEFNLSQLINIIADINLAQNDTEVINIAKLLDKNFPQKKLLIDISELIKHDNHTGIQRVVKSCLSYFLKMNINQYSVLPVYIDQFGEYRLAMQYIKPKSFDTSIDSYISFEAGDIYFCLDLLHPELILNNLEIFKRMKQNGVKLIFLVYDIIPILLPNYCNTGVPEGHRKWFKTIYELADSLISISKSVMIEVQNYAKRENFNSKKEIEYKYFHLGADIDNSTPSKGLPKNSQEVLGKFESTKTFLMVGTLEPRKGHKQTLLAFEKLWNSGANINLVIVGKQGWMMDDYIAKIKKHPELNKKLFWLEGISDEYLEKVYAASACLIAPSEGEGFGLPLIEAAQHKLPVIARDIPVFKEVAGEYAYYFENDNDSVVLEKAIVEWLEMYQNGTHPKSDEMPWLTWEESTKMLMEKIIKKEKENEK